MSEDAVLLPKWEKVPAGVIPDERGILFAAVLDGVVQQIFSFGAAQASLVLEQPEFVMCNSLTKIGMTKEEATATIEIPALTQ
jgi:hypothetical protein